MNDLGTFEPYWKPRQAFASFYQGIPEVRNWSTGKDCREECIQRIYHYYAKQGVATYSKYLHWTEHPEVLQQDRNFGAGER